jgi:uncharacterized protein YraI
MKVFRFLICAFTVTFALSAPAEDARTLKWANLRTGPDRQFALVVRLEPGTRVDVRRCTPARSWCEVIGPGARHGWVYSQNISYPNGPPGGVP